MWFLFTMVTTCAWGAADLFYKKGADDNDKYSHLETAMMVGFVMGIHAVWTLISADFHFDFRNLYIYLPVSAMYILSMTIGYLGLRYLELSISSPIQNSSGAVCCVLCLIFLGERITGLSAVGVILVCLGLFVLGLLEKVDSDKLASLNEKKYKIGFVAITLPILYCIIDSLGTFFDAYYLDDFETTPLLGVTEDSFEAVANMSYEFTFLICAIFILIFLTVFKHRKITLIAQKDRGIAALLETAGQATYVYALSANPAVAAPVISSYSIISLILSRIFLKEKLSKWHYAVIAVVIAGIAILGFAGGE